MTTVRTTPARVTAASPEFGAHTDSVRLQALKDDAAYRIRTRWFPRARKVYTISAKKLSQARHTGGAVSECLDLMRANPSAALEIAEFVAAFARRVAGSQGRSLSIVLSDEARADAAEDIAQDDLRACECPETLRAYLSTVDAAIAAAVEARDAAAVRLREIAGVDA
jgi:hypothetical protein